MNWKQLLLTVLVAVLAGLFGGYIAVLYVSAEPRTDDIVTARGFHVVDAEGKSCITLGFVEDRPTLTFLDDALANRIMLSLRPDGPLLQFFDENEMVCAALAQTEEAVTFALADERVVRVGIQVKDDGPRIVLHDTDGRERAVLGCTSLVAKKTGTTIKRSESSLVLFDKEGNILEQQPLF